MVNGEPTTTKEGKYIGDVSSNKIYYLTRLGVLKKVTDNRTLTHDKVTWTNIPADKKLFDSFQLNGTTVMMGSDLSNNDVVGNEGKYLFSNELFTNSNLDTVFKSPPVFNGCYATNTTTGISLEMKKGSFTPWECKNKAMNENKSHYALANCQTNGSCSCYVGSINPSALKLHDASCSLVMDNSHNHVGVTLENVGTFAAYNVGNTGISAYFGKAAYIDADSNAIFKPTEIPFHTTEDNNYTAMASRVISGITNVLNCDDASSCRTSCTDSSNCWGYQVDPSVSSGNKLYMDARDISVNNIQYSPTSTVYLRQKKIYEGMAVPTTEMQRRPQLTDYIQQFLQSSQYNSAMQLMDELDTKILSNLIEYSKNARSVIDRQNQQITGLKRSFDASFSDLFQPTLDTSASYQEMNVPNKLKDEYLSMTRHKYVLLTWSFISICAIVVFTKINRKNNN
jgi:hypothetical protein